MKILIVHNHYGQYAVGGEANVMRAEANLLKSHGHDVMIYELTNAAVESYGFVKKLNAFWNSSWSKWSADEIGKIIDQFRPDIMHVHNYWFLLTPSIFAAAKQRRVATVLTLHNYRLICPGNQLLRNGSICNDCLKGWPWRVILHRCYPGGSLAKSLLSLRLYLDTKKRKFLSPWVDAYVALTVFGKRMFVEGGLPEDKIFVKPNYLDDPLNDTNFSIPDTSHGAIFVGRISPEKGLIDLMKAWNGINYPLVIVGDGPQMEEVRRNAPTSVFFAGALPYDEVLNRIAKSSFLVFPSSWYEGFPLTILEAMALGKPVIASALGPRREMVHDGTTGLLFRAGDAIDLNNKVKSLIENPKWCNVLGKAGRDVYLKKYTAEINYEMLMNIYSKVQSKHK